MLHFFPSTFPDETLYSRLARYHRLSGHPDDRDSLHELVGMHTHVITSDLPSLLQALLSRLPASARPSVEEIVNTNTIFPYFQRFLPGERCNRAIAAMSGASTSGLKTAIGLVASRLGAKNPFRFCKDCLRDDEADFGQAYWHRVHQLPGAWVCPRHAHALFELDFRTVELKRHKLFLPNDPFAELASHELSLSPSQTEAVARITALGMSALLGSHPSWHTENLNALHQENAKRNGLVRNNGRIHVDELACMLKNYASDFPTAGEYAILHHRFLDWALRLLRKPRGVAVHPMKHLLLMDCLRGETQARVDNGAPDQDRMLARNKGRHQLDQARLIEMVGEEGASLRHAATELGYSVTTLGVEAARLGLPVGHRPKNITEDVKAHVCDSLRSGLAPKEVADAHGISQISVYRIMRMDEVLSREWANQRFRQRRDAYRERFASQASSTRADYAWLYRNDRQWLTEQQAANSKGETQRESYIDWAERDKLLAQQVVELSDSMRNAPGKPQWISRLALERGTGLTDTIERNPDKLPRTHLALSAHSESHEEYQGRLLYWAAAELKKSLHGPPRRWRLLRHAGIRILAKSNENLLGMLASC